MVGDAIRLLLFAPLAVLTATASVGLWSAGAIPTLPVVLIHIVCWAPTLLLLAGIVMAWQGRGIPAVLIALAVLAMLVAIGAVLLNWPPPIGEVGLWAWVVVSIVAAFGGLSGARARSRRDAA